MKISAPDNTAPVFTVHKLTASASPDAAFLRPMRLTRHIIAPILALLGVLRLSAQDLRAEVESVEGEIAAILRRNNVHLPSGEMEAAFRRAEEKK